LAKFCPRKKHCLESYQNWVWVLKPKPNFLLRKLNLEPFEFVFLETKVFFIKVQNCTIGDVCGWMVIDWTYPMTPPIGDVCGWMVIDWTYRMTPPIGEVCGWMVIDWTCPMTPPIGDVCGWMVTHWTYPMTALVGDVCRWHQFFCWLLIMLVLTTQASTVWINFYFFKVQSCLSLETFFFLIFPNLTAPTYLPPHPT
jgi:hypothetical protein